VFVAPQAIGRPADDHARTPGSVAPIRVDSPRMQMGEVPDVRAVQPEVRVVRITGLPLALRAPETTSCWTRRRRWDRRSRLASAPFQRAVKLAQIRQLRQRFAG